jgi:NAD(P)H-dependent nitrite reductase small subunit
LEKETARRSAGSTVHRGQEAMSEFVAVAEAASLPPGQGRTVNYRGREFALYNVAGQFYAMDDACPHKGGPLGAGCLEGEKVYCPLHGWAFDIKTGICSTRPDLPVQTYETRVVDGQVQIKI